MRGGIHLPEMRPPRVAIQQGRIEVELAQKTAGALAEGAFGAQLDGGQSAHHSQLGFARGGRT
jgi:hypothetical protein